jgi:hypothetical protein
LFLIFVLGVVPGIVTVVISHSWMLRCIGWRILPYSRWGMAYTAADSDAWQGSKSLPTALADLLLSEG